MSFVGLPTRAATHDVLLDLVTAQTVVTTNVQIGSILDLKALQGGYGHASLNVVVSAFDVADGDETVDLFLQGSNDAAFTGGGYNLAVISLAAAAAGLNAANVVTDLYQVPVHNQGADKSYRYARLVSAVGGTTPSITIEAAYLSDRLI